MTVRFSPLAERQFLKLERAVQKRVQKYILELQDLDDPRSRGKPLVGNLGGFWRYRVGDYRILCRILDDQLIVMIVEIGHRRDVYKG